VHQNIAAEGNKQLPISIHASTTMLNIELKLHWELIEKMLDKGVSTIQIDGSMGT